MRLPPIGARCVNRAPWLAAAVVALGVSVSAPAAAQEVRRDSACALPSPAHDSVHVIVTAIAKVVWSEDDPRTLPAEFLPYIVEAVRSHFTPPTRLDLAAISGGMPKPPSEWCDETPPRAPEPGPSRSTPLLAVDAYFTLSLKGAPRDVVIGRASMNDALVERVAAAIAAITPADYGLLPPHADGVRVHLHVAPAPFDTPTEQPFFAAWLPIYQVQHDPSVRHPVVQPEYPSNARALGIGDSVVTSFAIGADGHAIPGTIDILSAHYRDFEEAVVPAILHNSYDPAVAEGCAVPSTVRQVFTFTIRR